ncbi:MAG: low molecular weight phosphotyrosine protein phosphatase [Pseudomonadota bacterium]
MKRVLFVCGRGRARSPTAAQVFADWPGVSTDFGGVSPDADDVLSADQIDWADLIIAMDAQNVSDLEALRPAGNATPVRVFTEFAPGVGMDYVPDPYYTRDFAGALQLIEEAAAGLKRHLGV